MATQNVASPLELLHYCKIITTTTCQITMKKLLAILALSASTAAQAVNYEITILDGLDPGGTSLAYGMNDNGQVVGQAYNSTTGVNEAVLWDNGVIVSFGVEGLARAVNNDGVVVGESGNANLFLPSGQAFIWDSGVYTTIPNTGAFSGAYDINENGVVTGYAFFDATLTTEAHGFVYANGVTSELYPYTNVDGYSRGHGINEAGVVAGRSSEDLFGNSDKHMATWSSTGVISYQPTPYTYSTAQQINNNGIIVGNAHNSNGGDMEALIWNTDGSITWLGTFGGTQSRAYSINDSNVTVGFAMNSSDERRAMVSLDGLTIQDLNTLVLDMTGWQSLDIAYDINANGDIVGVGTLADGTQQAFLLTAVPIPAAAWLFISALGLLGFTRKLKLRK